MKYKTLVLSGSSANGLITLGAAQFLYNNGFLEHITNFIGTSSGSIICSLLALGFEPFEILCTLCKDETFESFGQIHISNFLKEGHGLLKFEKIKEALCKIILEKISFIPTLQEVFDTFHKEIVFSTCNFSSMQHEYVTRFTHPTLSILDAIHMSSCFPLIFEPFQVGEFLYIDGGVGDNFPIRYAKTFQGSSIGICVLSNPKEPSFVLHKLFLLHNNLMAEKTAEDNNFGNWIFLKNVKPNFFNFAVKKTNLVQTFFTGFDEMKTKVF
jgi:predicted acylesterase/phospholipase RssA